jgi:sulfatase maturation enzyme AslB (radical SAM superfamily)
MAVDWFGGEPLLALGAIEYLSQGFLDLYMREVQKKEHCQYYQQHENQILAAHLELSA